MTEKLKIPKLRFKEFSGEWEEKKLGEISERVQGNNSEIAPVMTISAIKGWMNQEDRFNKVIAGKELKNYTFLKFGELSYNHGNSKSYKYGTVYMLDIDSALVPKVYHSFKLKQDNPIFIQNYFHSKKIDSKLRKYISSTARMDGLLNISFHDFMLVDLFLPSTEEQTKIGDLLSLIDKKIELEEKSLVKLNELKKGYMQKIFNQEIRFTDEHGNDYPEWEEKKLGEIAEVNRGLTYKPKDVVNYGIRVLRSSNIQDNIFIIDDLDVFVNEEIINIEYINDNDIIVTAANGSVKLVGKHAIIKKISEKMVHGGFMLKVSSKYNDYINQWMSTNCYNRQIYNNLQGGNGALGNISQKQLINFKIKLPSLPEQTKIANFLSKQDELIEKQEAKIALLKEQKKGLLQQMFV